MGALRGGLAALAAFGAAWAALSWRPVPPAKAEPAGPGLASAPPAGGERLSLRRVLFNGTPSTVAVYRFPDPPDRVLGSLSADLSGHAIPFQSDRAREGVRLRWRDPRAGSVEAFVRAEGKGTSVVWSERGGKAWVPDGGDCPGRDLEGVGRPEGWRRLFCIDASNRRMLCYAASEGPEEAEKAFSDRLGPAGWKAGPGPEGARMFFREGRRCLVSAEAAPGGSQVTVIEEER